MRVLRIFFTSMVLLLIGGLVAFFVGREVLLYAALDQLRSAARELRTLQAPATFIDSCLEYGGRAASDTQALTRSQLRFVSSTQFVTEIVCNTAESLRQEARNETLPPFAEKTPNQSGIIHGQEGYGLTVSVLGRTGTVYEEGVFVKTSLRQAENVTLTGGPVTTCEGFGLRCCNETYQVGQGEQNTRATDCPRSCFAQCAEKPAVLIFSSDPPPNPQNRVVTLRSGESMDFYYTVNDVRGDTFGDAQAAAGRTALSFIEKIFFTLASLFQKRVPADEISHITLRFGDGEAADLSDLQGTVNHAYTCTRSVCVYNATIQVVTKAGTASTLGGAETIQVQVTP